MMNSPATSATRRDAFSFYAIACISLFESAVSEYVTNLRSVFGNDAGEMNWLVGEWLPEELEHGRLTRTFVVDVWPEFSWQSAFEQYLERIPRNTTGHLRNSAALEALARCVTETHATAMYRCIASYSQDQRLRKLLLKISRDEVRHYKRFREIYETRETIEKNGFLRSAQTIFRRSSLASGRDMEVTFAGLNDHWTARAPFTQLTFDEFMRQVREVVKVYYPTESAIRMLLRPLGAGTVLVRGIRWTLRNTIKTGLATRRLGNSGS